MRDENRAKAAPEFVAFVDAFRNCKYAIKPHAVVLQNGERIGNDPLPFRRDGSEQPKIPGVK